MANPKLTPKQLEYIEGLANLAEFLAKHPDLIPDYSSVTVRDWVYSDLPIDYPRNDDDTTDYDALPLNKEERDADVKTRMAAIARTLGSCEKEYEGTLFALVKKFGPHKLRFEAHRDAVCRKVVTGTKMVEKVDYTNAPKTMVSEEVVEWVCDEPLLSADPVVVADGLAGARDNEYSNER